MPAKHHFSIPKTASWRKASYSASQTDCVEVADWPAGAAVRDTKHRELGALHFSAGEWDAFLTSAKR
ncbi:DUF397 domain-containing protein [Nocardiopsis kunsanensis]|uniref:DUF397 domain-containing protein n=1 Tax=Nocardiopsis kunsanensis TaxID=141693 RepID=A0A919CK35_9ACTN|nr:DUF397 domain-containing protein [Nocardiopsis kunsanensis]GHD32176.1 hypothetical protein GCM10007147_35430 [Nocardiopsis kunsanensis]